MMNLLFIISGILVAYFILKLLLAAIRDIQKKHSEGGVKTLFSNLINDILSMNGARIIYENTNSMAIGGLCADNFGNEYANWMISLFSSFNVLNVTFSWNNYSGKTTKLDFSFDNDISQTEIFSSLKNTYEKLSNNSCKSIDRPQRQNISKPNIIKQQDEADYAKEMISLATDFANSFIDSAPRLLNAIYNRDEVFLFCCWVLLDYGKSYGYLNNNSELTDFYDSISKAVRRTGKYNQTDIEQFLFRTSQYKEQISGMLQCDYPRTKMFFPKVLFSRFVDVDFDKYVFNEEQNILNFSKYFSEFWNMVNRKLLIKYPQKKS